MQYITPEDKKLDAAYRIKYRVIVTNASGQVVLVSRVYLSESAAIKRLEKETNTRELPALIGCLFESGRFGCLFAYQDE